MKSGKTIETAQRALEILQSLMQQKLSVEEILDILISKQDYNIVFTKEAIYKYFNTFKIFGIEIDKKNCKYSVAKGPIKIDLSQENILILGYLENYIKATQQPEIYKKFQHIKNLIEKNNVDLVSNIVTLNYKNIIKLDEKYQNYKKLISDLEKYCLNRQKIKLSYKTSKGNILDYKIIADKIVFEKGFLYLRAYCIAKYELMNFLIEKIDNIIPLPQIGNSEFYINSTTFKLTGSLAKNYKLKTGETIKEEGDDFLIIINNYQNHDDLIKRLLRYSDKCEILYPKELRQKMYKKIEETLKKYEK